MANFGNEIEPEIVSCLWFGSHFKQDELETRKGEKVNVISPGWWNVEDGPTFVRAELEFSDSSPIQTVDIEIYSKSSDIKSEDKADVYVVFWDDTDEDFNVPIIELCRACGSEVEVLTYSEEE